MRNEGPFRLELYDSEGHLVVKALLSDLQSSYERESQQVFELGNPMRPSLLIGKATRFTLSGTPYHIEVAKEAQSLVQGFEGQRGRFSDI